MDFIVRSVQTLLQRDFNVCLSDDGVHVLDPFVGTGTFITRLIQSDLIDHDKLLSKYATELHANDIMLLAYYIAAVNIEAAYTEIADDYQPFAGIVLTDTFQASEASDRIDTTFFPRNNARMDRQLGLDIRVILGNPPWSSGQGSYEDDNANRVYPDLDDKIASAYVESSDSKGLKSALYDSYVRAIRWASDRVQEGNGGIIGFVTNRGFLDGKSFDGFRDKISKDYHSIYIYDLRGNARTSGETRRREGGGVFDQGSRAGVAILFLVKQPGPVADRADIYYYDVGDYLTREQKLRAIEGAALDQIGWLRISPNRHSDWINQRSENYLNLRPVAEIQSESSLTSYKPLFESSSFGITSRRDIWVFNSSEQTLRNMVHGQLSFYNEQVEALKGGAKSVRRDPAQFKWDLAAERRARRGFPADIEDSRFRSAIYRRFSASTTTWIRFSLARSLKYLNTFRRQMAATHVFSSNVGCRHPRAVLAFWRSTPFLKTRLVRVLAEPPKRFRGTLLLSRHLVRKENYCLLSLSG